VSAAEPVRAAAPSPPDFSFEVPAPEDVQVLIVDDSQTSLQLLTAFLERSGHTVRAFTDPIEALEALRAEPPQVLVTDLVMPGMTGLELAEQARSRDPDIAVVLVTAYADDELMSTAPFGIQETLKKPVDRDELAKAVQRAFLRRAAELHHRAMLKWMYGGLARNADSIREVTLGALSTLVNALDARSHHFRGHSRAVAMQAAAVAQKLGMVDEEVEYVRTAGLLHDIGMIGVPDAVVEKPDTLTPTEVGLIQAHCEKGVSIIEPMQHLGPAIRYVLEHHERWDGSGYPDGKSGEEISLGGQIVGIAEAWTGIIESRPYREGRSREAGKEILLAHRGDWFTDEVTEALLDSDLGLIG